MSELRPFVVIPTRVWNLPGITIQLLKFYEKIFQFWYAGRECFLSNKVLMEYAGMTSESTLSKAFQFFESHNELKRVYHNGQRLIMQPRLQVQTDDQELSPNSVDNSVDTPLSSEGGVSSQRGGTLATARHNNNNLIKANLIKSFRDLGQEQKAATPPVVEEKKPEKPHLPYLKSGVTQGNYRPYRRSNDQPTETFVPKPCLNDAPRQKVDIKRASEETIISAMASLPANLRPKRYKDI